MPYTMTTEENGKATAVRTALTEAKGLLLDAEGKINAAISNTEAFMAIEKAAGRADTYTAAFKLKGDLVEALNMIGARRGALMSLHASVSLDLQKYFTDGPAFVLSGPVR